MYFHPAFPILLMTNKPHHGLQPLSEEICPRETKQTLPESPFLDSSMMNSGHTKRQKQKKKKTPPGIVESPIVQRSTALRPLSLIVSEQGIILPKQAPTSVHHMEPSKDSQSKNPFACTRNISAARIAFFPQPTVSRERENPQETVAH
ncbi:hypothetical protein JTE90_014723 [Oedothorax gibbosus]|uniref:Uncharacterized protein n=1 Tax=Oedothorax gibbosus TaxID=931172 RepID=A0AAV6US54_9ARAC|nr:hypothetical protein JTE90_014723 [Oedothorax gibbosus]